MPALFAPDSSGERTREWMRRRSAIMHDWLSTKHFLGRLRSIALVLSGRVQRVDWQLGAISDALVEWREKEQEIDWLVHEFEVSMSPAALVGEGPLAQLNYADRARMEKCVHALWLNRLSVERLRKRALAAKLECTSAAATLAEAVRAARALDDPTTARSVDRFSDAMRTLHTSLAAFPSRVRVT